MAFRRIFFQSGRFFRAECQNHQRALLFILGCRFLNILIRILKPNVGSFSALCGSIFEMSQPHLFLVGAFSFKEKSPTITVASFFFFRQTTELIAYVPLFTETDKFTQAKFDQCKLTAKGPPFVFYLFYVTSKTGRLQRVPLSIFFGTVRIFFSKIFNVSKESPFGFFDILQQKVC